MPGAAVRALALGPSLDDALRTAPGSRSHTEQAVIASAMRQGQLWQRVGDALLTRVSAHVRARELRDGEELVPRGAWAEPRTALHPFPLARPVTPNPCTGPQARTAMPRSPWLQGRLRSSA